MAMPTTALPDGRRLAAALAAWVAAVHDGDDLRAGRWGREAARLARSLARDPVLGPAVRRHLGAGMQPASPEAAVACVLAVMAADASARAAAAGN